MYVVENCGGVQQRMEPPKYQQASAAAMPLSVIICANDRLAMTHINTLGFDLRKGFTSGKWASAAENGRVRLYS
jgi:hypothetical protein